MNYHHNNKQTATTKHYSNVEHNLAIAGHVKKGPRSQDKSFLLWICTLEKLCHMQPKARIWMMLIIMFSVMMKQSEM